MRALFAFVYFLTMGLGLTVSAAASTSEATQSLSLSYNSPVVIQQGNEVVTLADVVAYMDWRVPPEDQKEVLASPARIEALLEAIVLGNGFLRRLQALEAFTDPIIQSRIYQAAAREARAVYREKLREDLSLDDYTSQARELFMVEKDKFVTDKTIDFDHILIAHQDNADPAALMRRALAAHDSLSQRPFAEVAEEFSDDAGFEEHRGKFENMPIDSLVKPLAEAARELELGQFSAPVQSSFGWHIMRITSFNEPKRLSWEEAQPIAEEIARNRHLNEAFERRLRELNTAPMQFAEGAVKKILEYYEMSGFGQAGLEANQQERSND